MRNSFILIITAISLLISTSDLNAQWIIGRGEAATNVNLPKSSIDLKSMSLLDPDRFTMKQQSMISYSSSGMSGGNLVGMYVNTMEYQFNMPLTMKMKVAYRNNMGNLIGKNSVNGNNPGVEMGTVFVPSFDMIYTPWDNFSVSLHYRDYSGMMESGYGHMGSSYSFSPYSRYYSDPLGLYR